MDSIKQKVLVRMKQGIVQEVRNKSYEHFYQEKEMFDKETFIEHKLTGIEALIEKELSKLTKKKFKSLLGELNIEIEEEKKFKQKFYKPTIKEKKDYKESLDWIREKFRNYVESLDLKKLADEEYAIREKKRLKKMEEEERLRKINEQKTPFVNEIQKRTEEALTNAKDKFIKEIANWFAYKVLTSEKLIVDYSEDPYWDSSGKIVFSGEKFDLESLHSFEEFLEEYNGESEPSFMSGCGMFHLRYERNLEEWIRELVWDNYQNVVEEYLSENQAFKNWALDVLGYETETRELCSDVMTLFSDDDLDDFLFYEMETELRETVINQPVETLFEIGYSQLNENELQAIALNDRYYEFLKKIKSLTGLKVIHMAVHGENVQMFELEGDELTSPFTVNGMSHYERFKRLFMDGMKNSAGITIRQYTGMHRIELDGEDTKKHYVSNIYGIRTGQHNWTPVSVEEMEMNHRTQPNGRIASKEKFTKYCILE